MTISKERLNEIALEVAKSFICDMEGYIYFGSNPGIPEDDITDFAHALLKAVEAESEVARGMDENGCVWVQIQDDDTKLIALPLIELEE